MLNHLPEEVVIKILTPLPIKTLVQLTAVCKYWLSLIKNPSFITHHLKTTTTTANHADLMLVRAPEQIAEEEEEVGRCSNVNDKYSFSLYHHENQTSSCKLSSALRFPKDYSWGYRVIDVIDGLICLSRDAHGYVPEFMLWNPCIHKFVETPEARVRFLSHGPYDQVVGFGAGRITNDYKIVRVVYLNAEIIPAEVDVFSLSTGSWRNISDKVSLRYNITEKAPQAYLNGVVHWDGNWNSYGRNNGRPRRTIIVSFNVDDEVFGEIYVPDTFRVMYDHVHLMVYQGKLAWVEWSDIGFSMWVMREYGIAESWTKLFTFDSSPMPLRIRGVKNYDHFVVASREGHLLSIDPNAGKVQDLGIPRQVESQYRRKFYAASYRESLVLLGHKDSESDTSKQSIGEKTEGTEDNEEKEEEKGRAKNTISNSEDVDPKQSSEEEIQGTDAPGVEGKFIEEVEEEEEGLRAVDWVEDLNKEVEKVELLKD